MTINFWILFLLLMVMGQTCYWLGVWMERRSWKKRANQGLAQLAAYSSIGAPTSTVKPCTCPRQWGNGGRIGTASACPTHGDGLSKNI